MTAENHAWPWFALQVKGRQEKNVADLLDYKGYERFLPLYKCRRPWSDRIKELELPLFPGYLFCRLDLNVRLPILKTPGVLHIVGIGKRPIPVEEGEIAAIQSIMNSRLPALPWPFTQVGQIVRIDHGPLSGLDGIVVKFKSQHRLIVSVTLLQRSVAVEIEEAWVSPSTSGAAGCATEPGHSTLRTHAPADRSGPGGYTQIEAV
ncbi:MAG: NusG-like protein [Acidobacteria bacterium]|nr:MAG: NusG-like protein [Acidobacteriota bacterium]